MDHIKKINENIYRFEIPYKDIYTTVYTIKTDDGVLIFDAASSNEDIETYVLPYLKNIGIITDMVKYIFISHNHLDHAYGIGAFVNAFPEICVITRSPELKEKYENEIIPNEGDVVLGTLEIIPIPGHTQDSAAIYDKRTKSLITGDCLQLWGIFGSGAWAANIGLPEEHLTAIEKLKNIDIEELIMAHDYHPCGWHCIGKTDVNKALDACIAPLEEIKTLIIDNPEKDDEGITELFNNPNRPTLGVRAVSAIRKTL